MIHRWCALAVFAVLVSVDRSGAAEAQVRSVTVTPVGAGRAGFTSVEPDLAGVAFTNRLSGDAYLTDAVAHNGSGVAVGDVDGDGRPEIYLCALEGPNRMYRNLGGFRFEPMDPGVAACSGQRSTGAVLADVDGDGDLDLLVNGIAAGTRLFLNGGTGQWTESASAGLSKSASATSMALADMDNDGDLDLYCAHYIDVMHLVDPTTRFGTAQRDGRWVVTSVNDVPASDPRYRNRFEVTAEGEVRELPDADALYRNDGGGRFTPVQDEPGRFLDESGRPMNLPRDWGMAVVFRDLDGDGAPDLYVCNDFGSPDRCWINDGRGRFQAIHPLKLRHTCFNAMGADVADVDRDGWDDLVVMDLLATQHGRRMRQLSKTPPDPAALDSMVGRPQFNRNMLYLGRPGGVFLESALQSGVAASDWSWCPVFLDVDLDGYEDLLVTSGFEFDLMDQDSHDRLREARRTLSPEQRRRWMQHFPHWRTGNHAYRNRGDGTFESRRDWGFSGEGLTFGMALGDLDSDGDLDAVVNRLNGPVGLYRNDSPAPRVSVRLRGRGPNSRAVGSRVGLEGAGPVQTQVMVAGGRYLSGDESVRVFAAPAAGSQRLSLVIRWPNGSTNRVLAVEPNRAYEITEPSDSAPPAPVEVPGPVRIFADATELLGHDLPFEPAEDSVVQPLVPRQFSRWGPGVAWTDLDSDGWEDLVIGAPRGGSPAVFRNERGRAFARMDGMVLAGGQRGVVGWTDGRGKRGWLGTVLSRSMDSPAASRVSFFAGTAREPVSEVDIGEGFAGPLAVGDVDADGDLDVFVGGQYRPGRYPEPSDTSVWLNDAGALKRVGSNAGIPARVGCVNGATFADLDGDGDPDLALAVEWGPVRLFRNQGGRFDEVTEAMGLSDRTGWWTGIAAGDFDGDGRLDLAVGNAGRNTAYALYSPGPYRLYHGDWDGSGRLGLVEAWRREGDWLPIQPRSKLSTLLPDLASRFATHESFGRATLPEILGASAASAAFVEAVELDSGVFLNRGDRFEWRPLPPDAQRSPAFAVQVLDADGDGREDLFLSQNRSDLLPELSRDDSGRSLLLRGNGEGGFRALDATESGLFVLGEQRAAAVADFNHDGRTDVVVTQVNGPTRLLVNRGGLTGLRVSLAGPPANPDAVGALVRLHLPGGGRGPVRAILGGSGFGSQDAATVVLGAPVFPESVWVRWPGGREQVVPISPGHREVRVTQGVRE